MLHSFTRVEVREAHFEFPLSLSLSLAPPVPDWPRSPPLTLSLLWRDPPRPHLQQAVPHQREQQGSVVSPAHHGRRLRGVHAGEVEHGHVRLAVVVHGEVQAGQPVARGESRRLAGVRLQCILVHVPAGQQELRVRVVLGVRGQRSEVRGVWAGG